MRPRRAVGVLVAAAVLAWSAATGNGTALDERDASEKVRLLDVPYVPQSGVLCGGAALAMVLRYWGKVGALAEDFAPLVAPRQSGIRTEVLVEAVAAFGWTALPMLGSPGDITSHIALGRPVIALIRTGSDAFHYVVVVAWANGWVIVHDPNTRPFRVIRQEEFEALWSGSGSWALLVLPPHETNVQGASDIAAEAPPPPAALDECDAMVEQGIRLAQEGDTAEAELEFLAAQSLRPGSGAPLRERAGLRFRAEDWAGASRLAERALILDPNDSHAWRLLAGSRYLAGDVEGALQAWNHVSEPLTDLTRIDGLTRIRFSAVAGQIDLPPGSLLTPQAFRKARRRLAELPAQTESRLGWRPAPGGTAQVNVTLLERPPLIGGPWDVGNMGIKALVDRGITLDVASPTGNGELWTAGWSWWTDRPRVSLTLAVPAAGGRPGIWRLDGFWERQTYAPRAFSDSSGASRANPKREERRRTALSYSDWPGPDLRIEIGAALDEWNNRGSHLSLDGDVETRWARDRLALGARVERWFSLASKAPFGSGSLSVAWSSDGLDQRDAWHGNLGVSSTTRDAPLALWSGAGTGAGRAPLLRAHPLLNGGVLQGRAFGRTLVHGTVEKQVWPWTLGPVRLGWALFVDGARPWGTGDAGRIPLRLDGGTGLRLRGLGIRGRIRIDAAHGLVDGESAVSMGWQIP